MLRRVAPAHAVGRRRGGSGIAAGVGVVLASLAFTVEYAIGGTGGASVATVAAAMVGVHVLIGIGEGVITALTVSAVLAARPDLVYGARDLLPPTPIPDDRRLRRSQVERDAGPRHGRRVRRAWRSWSRSCSRSS